jgi:thermostable 8-oxoguanine DNA glycosylase
MIFEAITDIDEVQARLMYAVIVAGKSAKFANAVMGRWFKDNVTAGDTSTFQIVRRLKDAGMLEESFRKARTGNYGKLTAAMSQAVDMDIDLLTCTPQDLEKIKGIGPKTSRFFIMWIRPDAIHAALDVHILRWMKGRGFDVPKSTPQSPQKYAQIEQWFIAEACRMSMTPRELDFMIWEEGSKSANRIQR